MALKDRSELEGFFADLTRSRTEERYQDLDFEVIPFWVPNIFVAVLVGWWMGLIDTLMGRRRGPMVRVYFQEGLEIDLWLETRDKKKVQADPLESRFNLSSINNEKVRAILSGPCLEDLQRLTESYRLTITDEWLQFGPLMSTPVDSAAALDLAVGLMKRLAQMVKSLRSEDDPAGQEASAPGDTPARPEMMEEKGAFETVFRGNDPTEAQMVEGILQENGLNPHLIGTQQAALLGAAPHIFALRIEVPHSQADAAKKLIASAGQPDFERQENPRDKRAVAFGIALVIPGGGHFYNRLPLIGGVLALCWVLGLLVWPVFHRHASVVPGVLVVIGAILCDVIGGQIAISRRKKGRQLSLLTQAMMGLIFAGILLGVFWAAQVLMR